MQTTTATVQDLFEGDKQFLIPLFQRHYVWERSYQWSPLWADIIAKARKCALDSKKPTPHFTGAIVIQQKSKPAGTLPAYEIIDGQQRLTTFQVILCAFRGVCRENVADNDDRFAAMQEEADRFLLNTSMRAKKQEGGKYKLMPTKFDREAMSWLIDHNSEITPKGRLIDAYQYFHREVKAFVGKDADKAENLLTTIRESFEFVEILIDGDDEPEMIFESLNARGKSLLAFDLLRNYLFLRTRQSEGEDRDDLYKKYWEHFETDRQWDAIVKVGRSRIALSELFLQHFLMAKLAQENVQPLFQTYREEYSKNLPDGYRTADELRDLHKYSQEYLSLVVDGHDSDVGRAMQIYHHFDVTSLRPFFLYLLAEAKVSGKKREHIFNALESYTVRRVLCTSQGHKNFNKFFPELIKRLRLGGEFSDKQLLNLLKMQASDTRKWPDNQSVRNAFAGIWQIIGVNRTIMRYILYRIECWLRHQDARAESGTLNFSGLTLEHILPQLWASRWALPSGNNNVLLRDIYTEGYKETHPSWHLSYAMPGEENIMEKYADAYKIAKERQLAKHSIGNLTLLTQSLNSSVSNAAFDKKKEGLEKSSLLFLNREVCRATDWDVAQIREREKYLYDIFCKIWPDAQWFVDNIPDGDD